MSLIDEWKRSQVEREMRDILGASLEHHRLWLAQRRRDLAQRRRNRVILAISAAILCGLAFLL